MLLHWEQLVHYFGSEIDTHRRHFDKPNQSTYGLLCCRFADMNTKLLSSNKEHAEERLLNSLLWQQVEDAVGQWVNFAGDARGKAIVVMALNRSPCHSRCVPALFNALNRLQSSFSRRFHENWRFILACRGAYQGTVTEADYYEHATTGLDIKRLDDAGWEACVLQTTKPTNRKTLVPGEALPRSGHQLLQAIMRARNVIRPTITRLE
ncbi:MAG: hypothetical protein KDJ27_00835 [Gammaproteobacteria bacterium]|nr:hypothetical protein [Gammaproteobacteria bacterium]